MNSLSYQLGRFVAKCKKSGLLVPLTLLMGFIFLVGYLGVRLSTPKEASPAAITSNLEAVCADGRSKKYQELMEKKSYWMASLQMAECGNLNAHPEYKQMEMAAELAHYKTEIAASGGDKARSMSAIKAMIDRGHPVSDLMVREYKQYEKAETARAIAAEAKIKKSQGVVIGMTTGDVLASSWGRPKKVNKTTRASGENQQWVYDGGYLYFENGILRTIQH